MGQTQQRHCERLFGTNVLVLGKHAPGINSLSYGLCSIRIYIFSANNQGLLILCVLRNSRTCKCAWQVRLASLGESRIYTEILSSGTACLGSLSCAITFPFTWFCEIRHLPCRHGHVVPRSFYHTSVGVSCKHGRGGLQCLHLIVCHHQTKVQPSTVLLSNHDAFLLVIDLCTTQCRFYPESELGHGDSGTERKCFMCYVVVCPRTRQCLSVFRAAPAQRALQFARSWPGGEPFLLFLSRFIQVIGSVWWTWHLCVPVCGSVCAFVFVNSCDCVCVGVCVCVCVRV